MFSGAFSLDDSIQAAGIRQIDAQVEANRRRMESAALAAASWHPKSVGIVGAGAMGVAIAAQAAARGLHITITDAAEAARQTAEQAIADALRNDYNQPTPAAEITVMEGLDQIAACDVVVECVVEDPLVKTPLLRDLEARINPSTLLTTNTSTLPMARLSRDLSCPERLCGTHFFLPLVDRAALELIFSAAGRPETQARAIRFAQSLDKIPLVAPDSVGFVVNRLMMPYVSEGMQLLTEGVEPAAIEKAAVDFGMPKGPLSLLDEIGLDTALDCGWVFAGAYEDRVAVSPLLVAMVKARRLGSKCGAGFFRYTMDKCGKIEQEADPGATKVVERWIERQDALSAEQIAARLFLPMVFEATHLLDETPDLPPGVVDLGVVFGLGMSPGRGGPLFWADTIGADRIVELAKPLQELGPRMVPPDRVRQMATGAEPPFFGAPRRATQ